MKTKVLSLVFGLLIAGSLTAMAEIKTEKFKVYGNCGMCENRIEKAVKAIDGVSAAEWNKDNKILEVTFDDSKTSLEKIHQAIADAGHDTDMKKADDKTYNDLPGCCHYERKNK